VRRAAQLLLGAAALAGCAALRPPAPEVDQVHQIVSATVDAARAAPEEQRRRLSSAQQAYAARPDDANRVRLGALFAVLPAPHRDDARASALLEPVASKQPASPVTELAGLLAAGVADRDRLQREVRAAEQRADAAAQRAEAAQQRAGEAERRQAESAERAATLSQQLEALKSIERSILEREVQRRNPKR